MSEKPLPSPPVLPPVPAAIQPPPMPQPPVRHFGRPAPTPAASAIKTIFDEVPASTVTARAATERARTNLQAAVRAAQAAKQSAEDLAKLAAANPGAADIATHEGVSPDTLAKFIKLAEPLVAAFAPAS